jgi:uncharacterized protein (DUF2252 family)
MPSSSHSASDSEVVHLAVAERVERGRQARKAVPRAGLGVWEPPASRANPVDLLHEQELTRVAELVPIRHERMLASPFAFYRGAAVIMAADLGAGPNSGLVVQCCGDAHLANFGGFAAPDRSMVFDINDFDETSHGPFEWDVKRLAASFEIAARSREFSPKTVRGIVLDTARTYREAMAGFATMSNLDVWYTRLDAEQVFARWRDQVPTAEAERIERLVAKAQLKDNLKAFSKLTHVVDGEVRIISDPPLIVPASELAGDVDLDQIEEWIRERFRSYRRSLQADRRHLLEEYRLVDVARKVVGVGSVGTRCWIALLQGKDDGDPLFLQIKEAEASVLERHGGKSRYTNRGQRVVEGQRVLQAASDIFLGWLKSSDLEGVPRDFYVRQLWDWKLSPDLERMVPEVMKVYAQMCGWTLARAHARSGDRIALAAYLGSSDAFDRAIGNFAVAYAEQNQRDYEVAKAALSSS